MWIGNEHFYFFLPKNANNESVKKHAILGEEGDAISRGEEEEDYEEELADEDMDEEEEEEDDIDEDGNTYRKRRIERPRGIEDEDDDLNDSDDIESKSTRRKKLKRNP